MGWLLILGLKKGLVECATVCFKSEVILVCTVCPCGKLRNFQHTNPLSPDPCTSQYVCCLYTLLLCSAPYALLVPWLAAAAHWRQGALGSQPYEAQLGRLLKQEGTGLVCQGMCASTTQFAWNFKIIVPTAFFLVPEKMSNSLETSLQCRLQSAFSNMYRN